MKTVIRELGDGLVLRQAQTGDTDRLVAFNSEIHGRDNELERRMIGAWTRDLISAQHPTFKVEDFLIVEDTRQAKIVSSLNLISQTWSYTGIPFKVGRIELVGTAPEYRRKGLVRKQFDEIHRWSQERGELVQAITGIPFYYRQFGYEMALGLSGGRVAYPSNLPDLPAGEAEPYRVRPATKDDLQFISDLYNQDSQRSQVSCLWSLELWEYELSGKCGDNINRKELRIITDGTGKAVGFLAHASGLWPYGLGLEAYILAPEVSWWEVTPGVMRYLWATGQAYGRQTGRTCPGVYFCLGEEHPVYPVFAHRLPKAIPSYAFYMRVPDLRAFLGCITPVLEKRLAEKIRPGYSGEMRIGFYRSGLGIKFEQGKLVAFEEIAPEELESVNAGFPGLTFLQILFGYRSLDDLRHAYPDCWVDNDKARPLLEALFPRQASSVWPIA